MRKKHEGSGVELLRVLRLTCEEAAREGVGGHGAGCVGRVGVDLWWSIVSLVLRCLNWECGEDLPGT